MRYIAADTGRLLYVSFGADIACDGQECTEYTGEIPEGYASLEAWYVAELETFYRWKVVDGQLTLDESAVAPKEGAPVTIYRCWTNSNIASSFAAQDIDTGITDGDLYMVTYAYGTTILAQKCVIAPMGKSARMDGVGAGTSSIEVVRTVSSSGGVLSFGSGYKNGAADNSLIIPARIYVIKGVYTV